MKNIIIFIILMFTFLESFSQKNEFLKLKMDSLSFVDNTKKTSIYIDLSSEYIQINIETSLIYAFKADSLASIIKHKEYEALAQARIGYIYSLMGDNLFARKYLFKALEKASKSKSDNAKLQVNNFIGVFYNSANELDSAINFFNKNVEISKKINNRRYEVRSYVNIAALLYQQGKYDIAIKTFLDALAEVDELKDWDLKSSLLMNIGNIYKRIDNPDKAIYYYKQSLVISKMSNFHNTERMAYSNISSLYMKLEKYEEALSFLNKADSLSFVIGDFSKRQHIYNQYARIYIRLNNYTQAENFLKKALEAFDKYGIKTDLIATYKYYAELRLCEKNYSEVLFFIKKAEPLLKEFGNLDMRSQFKKIYSDYYFATKRYKEAYLANIEYDELKDSIFLLNNLKIVEEQRARFESRKIEMENEMLKYEKKLANRDSDKKSAAINFLVLISTLLACLVVSIIYFLYKNSRTNRKLNVLNVELSKANDTKDKFFSILSHDLRSPFNTIIGFANLIEEEALELENAELIKQYSSKLLLSSERTLDLLDSILSWARVQSGSIELKKDVINVPQMLNKVVGIYDTTLKAKGIECSIICGGSCTVIGDENIVMTILRNLLSNSIKFTNEGGKISMGCTLRGTDILLFVRDNGVGMSKEVQESLFKAKGTTSKKGTFNEAGAGVGLLLIKDLAIVNGGDLWFESKENIGTCFYVSFAKI